MKLNLGSGEKKIKGYINIDNKKENKPDLIWNIEKKLPYQDNTIEEIIAEAIIEHLDIGFIEFITEMKRILKPDGKLKFYVPNCFHWKARIRYLKGEFKSNSGFHYNHRWLFKPSFCIKILEFYGFEVQTKHSDLFDKDIRIVARKRK